MFFHGHGDDADMVLWNCVICYSLKIESNESIEGRRPSYELTFASPCVPNVCPAQQRTQILFYRFNYFNSIIIGSVEHKKKTNSVRDKIDLKTCAGNLLHCNIPAMSIREQEWHHSIVCSRIWIVAEFRFEFWLNGRGNVWEKWMLEIRCCFPLKFYIPTSEQSDKKKRRRKKILYFEQLFVSSFFNMAAKSLLDIISKYFPVIGEKNVLENDSALHYANEQSYSRALAKRAMPTKQNSNLLRKMILKKE